MDQQYKPECATVALTAHLSAAQLKTPVDVDEMGERFDRVRENISPVNCSVLVMLDEGW